MRQLAFLSLVCIAPYLAANPLLTAYRAEKAPVVDGELTDACWGAAIASSPFLLATGNGFPEEQTVVRVCWDDAHLCVGIEANEPLLNPVLNMLHKVKAAAKGRDASVFGDDCVELFLQPPDQAYVHFAANSASGTYEGRSKDKSWDCEWQCKTSRGKASYVVEMAIPFAALGGKPEGNWTWNVTRHRPQAKEYSTWSGLQGAFHQPKAFGQLRFAERGPAASAMHIAQIERGETLSLASAAALAVRFVSPTEATHRFPPIKGDRTFLALPPPAAAAAGSYQFLYELCSGETVLARSPIISRALAAGVVPFTLAATSVEATVFLNGEPVALRNGRADLKLSGGMNILAIEAERTDAGCSLLPTTTLPLAWRVTADAPDQDWRTALPNRDWRLAPAMTKFWSGDDATRCFAVAAIFVDQSAPPVFPKSYRFLVPQGSTQLLRAYLPMSPDILTDDYQLVVETPARLSCTALEPYGAQDLDVAKTEDVAGVRRQFLSFGSVPGSGMELSLRWGDKGGSTLSYQPALSAGGTHDWTHLRATVTAPDGAESVHPLVIKWQNRDYVGTFWVDNIVFREEGSVTNLLTMGTFDEPEWKRSFPNEGVRGSKCFKVIAKPDETHCQQACWVDDKKVTPVTAGKRYVVELDVKCDHMGSKSARPMVGLLLKDDGSPRPEKPSPLRVYVSALGGSLVSWPRRGTVEILPPLRDIRPKRARIAPCYYGPRFSNPEVEKAYADNCYRSGITWTYGKTANGVVPHLAPKGHKVILSIGWHPWGVPPGKPKFAEEHPETLAVNFDGKPERHTICPTWFLSEGDELMAALETWLLSCVEQGDYTGANWDVEQPVVDPPTFCTCPRCLAAFRAWAKIPAAEAIDAKTLLDRHRDQWVDFRCMQNAEMAGRLRAMLRKSPHRIEFSLYSGYQSKRTKEHYGVDWARMAPHLDFAIAGYGGGPESIADTLAALDGVPFMGGEMWYLSDNNDARPTPRYETWRNRLLRQYAKSGGNGCLIWYLPPMDGGAFYATSEAAELIAKYEDFFTLEQRCDDQVKVTGIPASDWAAFARDGKVLVILLNFAGSEKTASVVLQNQTVSQELAPYGAETLMLE